MKKYLTVCLILIVVVLAADYLYYYTGDVYVPDKSERIACFATSDSESLYLNTGNGPETFDLRGVNLGLGKPGYFATEYAVTEEEYLRWFRQIQQMGANAIRIYTIANPGFYDAFYKYNLGSPTPLYLIHGISANDYLLNSRYDAFDPEFYEPFLETCKDVVDIVHGRHKRQSENIFRASYYGRDISPWVLGYLLGTEWDSNLVVYTNDCIPQAEQYAGEYLRTDNARNFEIFLAAIADRTIAYETEKYGSQRLLIFGNGPATSPLDFEEYIQLAFSAYGEIDANNIHMTERLSSGIAVSYNVYPFYPEYVLFEKEGSMVENTYLEYLTRLNNHHTLPVIISEFGVPSSRGMASYEENRVLGRDQGGISETKQGQALVSMCEDIEASGCAGGIVCNWQDEWYKRTWNTIPTVDLDRSAYWSDYQTNEQCFGLLSFDPGKEQSICYVDGDRRDWSEEDVVTEQEDFRLSMKYDVKFVYFLVEKEGLDISTDTLYIPVDTTWKSGSEHASNLGITMSEPTDFILQINGTGDSRLRVQERYNTTMALYGNQLIRHFNQFINAPRKDSSKFDSIVMPLREKNYFANGKKVNVWEFNFNHPVSNYTLMQTYETGKLTYGNANPDSPDFNSLADFCAGEGFVEIKLPWQLLNFADPTTMRIHDDYYECYGVEYLTIDSIRVGVGDGSDTIQMASFPMKKLGRNPEYHERLKQSYYILRAYWTGKTPQQ